MGGGPFFEKNRIALVKARSPNATGVKSANVGCNQDPNWDSFSVAYTQLRFTSSCEVCVPSTLVHLSLSLMLKLRPPAGLVKIG